MLVAWREVYLYEDPTATSDVYVTSNRDYVAQKGYRLLDRPELS